jgi:hypothetical protein
VKFNVTTNIIANAGADQMGATTCGLTKVTLSGNTPIEGSGLWTIVSGSGGFFGNPDSATSTFLGQEGNIYTLRWTISVSPCYVSFDEVQVEFSKYPLITKNLDPTILACSGDWVQISSEAVGVPLPTILWETSADKGLTWTPVSGGVSPNLEFQALRRLDSLFYRAKHSNICGSNYSNYSVLRVANGVIVPSISYNNICDSSELVNMMVKITSGVGLPQQLIGEWQYSVDSSKNWVTIPGTIAYWYSSGNFDLNYQFNINQYPTNTYFRAAVLNDNSCYSYSDTITVKVYPRPFIDYYQTIRDTIIQHNLRVSPIYFSGTNVTSFQWRNSNTTIGLSSSGEGVYLPSFIAKNPFSNSVVNEAIIVVTPTYKDPYDNTALTCYGLSDSFRIVVKANLTLLNLKAFIQGYYSAYNYMNPALLYSGVDGSNNDQTDTIAIEIHDSISGSLIAGPIKTIIQFDGSASVNFPIITGSHYIVLKHRNALETWSAAPVPMGADVSYDFTTEASKAYGNNQADMGNGKYAIWSGDLNQDGSIESTDYFLMENDILSILFGYQLPDINGDGEVESADYYLMENNILRTIFVQRPF